MPFTGNSDQGVDIVGPYRLNTCDETQSQLLLKCPKLRNDHQVKLLPPQLKLKFPEACPVWGMPTEE